ncbi:MAG: hypothetical protein ACI4GY_07110 [Acutalibacteraceae bacterium]
MINFLRFVLIFFFYSAAGWAVESTYCSIGEKRFINRGFLTGPMCPIYGTGALVMTVFLYNPFYDRPLLVFLLGMLLCDIVEYITSFLMETLFHSRWWDYTYEFLNIRGRICLKHTLYWGVASVGFVYVIHPHIDKIISKFSDNLIIGITSAVLVVFAVDCIHSFIKALDIRNLQIKLSKAFETVSSGLNTVKNTIEDKYNSIQESIDRGNDKITNAKNEGLEQINEIIEQFEMRFARKEKNNPQSKYSSRYFHNNFEIEKNTKKQLAKLKELISSIKEDFFEDDENN